MGDLGVGGGYYILDYRNIIREYFLDLAGCIFLFIGPCFDGNGPWSCVTRKNFFDHVVATVNFSVRIYV